MEQFARLYAQRGADLAAAGQREAALEATREAVALHRALAARKPDAFQPDLARSVNNLGALNAYGPGQKLYPIRKAVPVMILQALHGLDVEIWGTGDQPVDLIHSEDLVRNTVQYTLADNIDSTVRCWQHRTDDGQRDGGADPAIDPVEVACYSSTDANR